MSAVTKLHLLGGGARAKGQKLVTQTNTKDGRAGDLESLGQVGNSDRIHDRIARTVGDEETVIIGVGIEVIVIGNDLNLDAACNEAADLVVFLFEGIQEGKSCYMGCSENAYQDFKASLQAKSIIMSYHSNIDSDDAKRLSIGTWHSLGGFRRVDLWLLHGHCRSKSGGIIVSNSVTVYRCNVPSIPVSETYLRQQGCGHWDRPSRHSGIDPSTQHQRGQQMDQQRR